MSISLFSKFISKSDYNLKMYVSNFRVVIPSMSTSGTLQVSKSGVDYNGFHPSREVCTGILNDMVGLIIGLQIHK
jgi:hypothetical protein